MPSGLSRLPIVTKIIPGKLSRLLVKTLAPQFGQKFRSSPLPELGNVVKRFRLAADQREIILGHAEERSRFAAGRLFAVQAMTDGNEGGIGIKFKLDGAAGALSLCAS